MCDRVQRTGGTVASQLSARSSSPALGLVLTWLPVLSKELGWLQASITHQECCCLCWHAQCQPMCPCQSPERRLPAGHSPRAEVLSSSGPQELWGKPHGMHLLAQELSQTMLFHLVMVSFILNGSSTVLSIPLGSPCSFLPQAVHPTPILQPGHERHAAVAGLAENSQTGHCCKLQGNELIMLYLCSQRAGAGACLFPTRPAPGGSHVWLSTVTPAAA